MKMPACGGGGGLHHYSHGCDTMMDCVYDQRVRDRWTINEQTFVHSLAHLSLSCSFSIQLYIPAQVSSLSRVIKYDMHFEYRKVSEAAQLVISDFVWSLCVAGLEWW